MRDKSIHSSMIKVPCYETCLFQLFRAEKRVERRINLDAKLMGVVAKFLDVLDGIARSNSCSEARSPDIDCVSTMINGCKTALKVPSWREKFYKRPLSVSPEGE